MRLYNTLNKKIEEFIPNNKDLITLYTCGPTVYHYAHIGNLRTYIFEDILEKGLNYVGYNVKRCMNITDVGHMSSDADTGEDKMIKGAIREHKTVYEIADFYTKAFFEDCQKLNIKKPEIVEKASDHIDIYIKMVSKLLDEGYAYIANGNVYFDISKANDYYKLSGKNPDELAFMMMFDINGILPPNTWGKDIYGVDIKNGSIKPFGADLSMEKLQEDCSEKGTGLGCSYYYNIGGGFND